jgi:glycosyltransferase involved in cell wall biosynthesis
MEAEWKRLAGELGLGDRARFLGNVPHRLIPLYIRAADVFVLNSEYEGLSHTLIEVATLGTAIVATGVCGNPEVVEDGVNGFLVRPKDSEQLAGVLAKLLADKPLREKLAAAARRDAGRFSRTATFSEVENVLQRASGC